MIEGAMIKLTCDCYVAADEVAEVTVNRDANTITVRMRNGVGHSVGPDYGAGIYATCDRLVDEINAQRDAAPAGRCPRCAGDTTQPHKHCILR